MERPVLLVTKLSRPRTSRWHLPRPHLTASLNDGLSRRLTALIAAAGHGKTCTLAHFLGGADVPYLWMQLDASDSDLHSFVHYLAEGIQRDLAGGRGTLLALESERPSAQFLPLLVEDLNACPGPVAVVFDDFHLIDRDSPVGQLTASLMQYCGEHVHFYVCSRVPLPFSIARMKVIQEAVEITEDDFRFTPGEVTTFMQEMAGVTLSETQLEQICHLTEGWSAALVLLAAGLKRRGSIDTLLAGSLPADLFTYLADELFHTLSPDTQRFMEETAILDACAPTACDGLLERKDSSTLLVQLLNSNLLLTQLGPDSFRYHHLLQRFLLERLRSRDSGETSRQLHKRAGDWFLSRDLPEEAVRYYLRGEWLQEAATLVEHLASSWLRTNKLERLKGLLAHIPTVTKEQYPWISLCEARHALNAGNRDAAIGMARLALRSFQEGGDVRGAVQAHTLIGEILALRQEYDAAMDSYHQAATALQPEYRHEEGLLLLRRASLNYMTKGATADVEADLRKALSLFVEVGDLPGEAAVSDILGVVRANLGDHMSALRFMERSVEILQSLGDQPYEVGANLAFVLMQIGRFRDAVKVSEPMLASSSRKVRRAYAAVHLLFSYTRLGEFSKAAGIVSTANSLAEELGHKELRATLAVDLSALYRLSGQSQASVQYANEALQLAKQTDRANFHTKPVTEAVMLHLFHTGNAASAARLAEKALTKLSGSPAFPFERMMLTLALAVAEFRQTRTESRPEAVRLLQEALSECNLRGYEYFALHEWPLALAVVVYGLAYGVKPDLCVELIRLMSERLPSNVLQEGITLAEYEARLVPAAWQALPDEGVRATFSHLLTPGDRRRVVGLATGPAPVRIHCLGSLVVTVGAEPVDVKALKKRKAGHLLVLLVSQDGPAPRDMIVDRLWPDLDADAADTSLRVTLHHLRRLLEPHLGGRSKSRYIQAEGGLIWFSRQPEVQIDLDQFREALAKAEDASGGVAAAQYEAACKSYRGEFCADDPYSPVLEDLRNTLRDQYSRAMDWLGEYYWKEAQDPAKAILAYKQRLVADPTHEPAHQALIRIYLETGQVAAARQQYSTCREALSTGLGVTPSRTTESLLQLALSMENESAAAAENVQKRVSKRR